MDRRRRGGRSAARAPRGTAALPARPDRPELLQPREVLKRKPGSAERRTAMLHAVAHIELIAVDLHWDVIARFAHVPMPSGFYDGWVKAADAEAKHFGLLSDCLAARGSHHGALPAHAGMWRAAKDTAEDVMGRLAVVPMVPEACGLDVTPNMTGLFRRHHETDAVAAPETIYAEKWGTSPTARSGSISFADATNTARGRPSRAGPAIFQGPVETARQH